VPPRGISGLPLEKWFRPGDQGTLPTDLSPSQQTVNEVAWHLVERRRVTAMFLATFLVLAAGCTGSSNATGNAGSIQHWATSEPADSGAAVKLANCHYSGATVTAIGTVKVASKPIAVARLTLSASDKSGSRITSSTTLVRDLAPNRSQHWLARAFLPGTTHSSPNSCYVQMNVDPPTYPGR
jgi:hypothetical protein